MSVNFESLSLGLTMSGSLPVCRCIWDFLRDTDTRSVFLGLNFPVLNLTPWLVCVTLLTCDTEGMSSRHREKHWERWYSTKQYGRSNG